VKIEQRHEQMPDTDKAAQTAHDPYRERLFLEGPRSRFSELTSIFKIAWEFLRVFRVLHFVGPCVTVFGSARFSEGHEYYDLTRKVGSELAELGFTVMTGGGPGSPSNRNTTSTSTRLSRSTISSCER
jgi:hypothetical protein